MREYNLRNYNTHIFTLTYVRINERRYKFGSAEGDGGGWVCSKVPEDGRLVKNCVPRCHGHVIKMTLY